jgi:hypothetical protein
VGRRRRRKACRVAVDESRERERVMSLTTVKLIIVVSFFFSRVWAHVSATLSNSNATAACDLLRGEQFVL